MRKIKYDEKEKTELQEALNKSKTLRGILTYLGRNDSSAAYKLLQRRLSFYNLDGSHLLNKSEILSIRHVNQRRENEEIFVQNSLIARSSLKKRILEDKLIEYKCDKCNNDGTWLGKEMTLILDHINGIPTDNRLSNLRFVCPNCNSLLETHCKGHKGLNSSYSSTD